MWVEIVTIQNNDLSENKVDLDYYTGDSNDLTNIVTQNQFFCITLSNGAAVLVALNLDVSKLTSNQAIQETYFILEPVTELIDCRVEILKLQENESYDWDVSFTDSNLLGRGSLIKEGWIFNVSFSKHINIHFKQI